MNEEEDFDILSESTALERAAANLDLASVHANKRKDIEGLITVAAAWMQVADRLSEEFMPKKKHSLGFGIEEEEEDDRIITNKSKGRSSVHEKPGELREHQNRYWR
jgi:hypothetical protein